MKNINRAVRSRFTKTFFRFYISYLMVLVIPVILLGFLTHRMSLKRAADEINQSMVNTMENMSRTFDGLLSNIENIAVNIAGSETARKVLESREPDFYSLRSMFLLLEGTASTNQIIADVSIYLIKQDKVLTSDGGVYTGGVFFSRPPTADQGGGRQRALWTREIQLAQTDTRQEQGDLLYIYKLPLSGIDTLGYLLFRVDEIQLWRRMDGFIADQKLWINVIDLSGEVISKGGYDDIGPHVQDAVNRMLAGQEDAIFISEKGRFYIVSSTEPASEGWRYVSAAESSSLARLAKSIKNITFRLSLFISLLGILIVYFIARRAYSPIAKLVNRIVDIQKSYEGADMPRREELHDDFKHMSEIVFEVFADNRRLSNLLRSRRDLVRDKVLWDLLSGRYGTDAEAISAVGSLDDGLLQGRHFVYLVELDEMTAFPVSLSRKSWRIFVIALQRMCDRFVGGTYKCVSLQNGEKSIAIICSLKRRGSRPSIVKTAVELQRTIKNQLDLSVTVGIGGVCRRIGEISQSYRDAERALKHKLVTGASSVIHIDDVSSVNGAVMYYNPSGRIRKLGNLLRSGDYEGLKSLVRETVGDIKKTPGISVEGVHQIFIRYLGAGIDTLLDTGGSMADIFPAGYSAYSELTRKETLEDIEAWMLSVFRKISDYLGSKLAQMENGNIILIKRFIAERYTRDISLDTIADEVNLNPTYVSNIFKKLTGENITKYINRMRIDKSKEMLLNTDSLVKEISSNVGYHSQNSFVKYFKLFEGVTPSQFREGLSFHG